MLDVADSYGLAFLRDSSSEAFFEGVHLFVDDEVNNDGLEVCFKAPFGEVEEGHCGGKTPGGWTCKAHPSRLWLRCCGCFGQFGNTLAGSSTAG